MDSAKSKLSSLRCSFALPIKYHIDTVCQLRNGSTILANSQNGQVMTTHMKIEFIVTFSNN